MWVIKKIDPLIQTNGDERPPFSLNLKLTVTVPTPEGLTKITWTAPNG
jgi:hypothetical protein